ncbi:MAG: 50S ribosomal protein L9 [Myxococcota bacterium]|jgi:large subunit ribosomal protein L9|nr:50S ribosomal protein L9 [Myxococcota bacterium]
MKVILRESVQHLGKPGAIVNVKPGFARNFLIPQGLAALATSRNIKEMDHQIRLIQREIDLAKAEAGQIKARLSGTTLSVAKPAGDNDKLFGSVTTRDIEEALLAQGITVDRKRIVINEPIKSLGDHTVHVRLHGGDHADIKLAVVKQ